VSSYTEVIKEAARVFKILPHEIAGKYKNRYILPARFAVYAALHERGNSLSQVGRWLKRDHSTIRNGLHQARELMAKDKAYKAKVDALIAYDWTKED
jgi:chromosomal replication initiation ATPase DnaA